MLVVSYICWNHLQTNPPPTIRFRFVSWHHLLPVITANRPFSCEISQTAWRETSHEQEHFVTLISSWNWSPWERSTKSNRPQFVFNHDSVQQSGLREMKPVRCCFCSWPPSCVQARYCGGMKALCPLLVSVSTNEQWFYFLTFHSKASSHVRWTDTETQPPTTLEELPPHLAVK